MAQMTENSGQGKKKLVAGQSPAARKSASNAAKYGAPAMSPAQRKKMDRIPGQSPAARSEISRKNAAGTQAAQAAAKAAGMQKRSGVVVVKSGDTLYAIAKANNTTVEKLKALNPEAAKRGIFSGSKVRVRPSAAATANAQAVKKQGAQAAAKAAGMKKNYGRRVGRGD